MAQPTQFVSRYMDLETQALKQLLALRSMVTTEYEALGGDAFITAAFGPKGDETYQGITLQQFLDSRASAEKLSTIATQDMAAMFATTNG